MAGGPSCQTLPVVLLLLCFLLFHYHYILTAAPFCRTPFPPSNLFPSSAAPCWFYHVGEAVLGGGGGARGWAPVRDAPGGSVHVADACVRGDPLLRRG